jgi:hypothetical protein
MWVLLRSLCERQLRLQVLKRMQKRDGLFHRGLRCGGARSGEVYFTELRGMQHFRAGRTRVCVTDLYGAEEQP